MRSVTFTLVAALGCVPAAIAAVPRHIDDAPLHAVQFIDRNEGWAVGDDGVVWHTIDGGETWEHQPTGVRGSLRALHFVTPYTGWVVGREELPNGGSAGIVLVTTDGGLKWSRLALNTLPGLHAVKFFNDRNGLAAGDATDRFTSGVYATNDGGQSWTILPGPRQPGWLTADFSDPRTGALAGSWSSIAMLRENVFGKSDIDTLGGRSILGLRLYRDIAFAVGQGGMILKSDDGGAKWKNASPNALAGDALTNCDFHAVHVFGEHVWVVGRPGSVVIHSSDYGKSWQLHPTGQSLPLHGIHFLDAQNGWAVGELGTILATADGGQTWKVQHRGGERAAALFIHADPGSLPLDAIAQLGANDGYLTAAVRLIGADPATSPMKKAADAQRWSQAVRLAGGASGECLWHFPLPSYRADLSAKELLAGFDPLHGGRAGEMMLRHLVLAIRIWQPELVVCDEAGDGRTALCSEAVKEAFQRAADPKAFPEQLELLGLKPWSAKKLYATAAATALKQHSFRTATTEPMSSFGESPREIGMLAAEGLGGPVDLPRERGYRLCDSRMPDAASHSSLMEGITLAHRGTARRAASVMTEAEIAALAEHTKIMQAKRNIEALARPDWKALGGPDQMIGQLGSMLKGLPTEQGGHAAYVVAKGFAQSGQWQLAREAFELMIARYPSHPLSIEAYRWLARYGSSSEARRRFELGQFMTTTDFHTGQSRADAAKDPALKLTSASEPARSDAHTPIDNPEARNWYKTALRLEADVAAFGPLYVHDPGFQFCMTSARRWLGQADAGSKWCAKFVAENNSLANAGADPWREIAATEEWLTKRGTRPPRPIGNCKLTTKRPYLDGKLDDDCWKDAKAMPLRTAAGDLGAEYTAQAMFAFDQEFLYIAIECKHPAGKNVPKVEKRKRDEDLHAYDRVGIMLDLDRDYQTYYHLQIDQRGCLAEDCWGDATWNPKWFVALDSNANGWIAEIAIPRSELTGDAITAGKAWACNVVRIVPGKGIQSWSLPADIDPRPEGMGLLIFTEK